MDYKNFILCGLLAFGMVATAVSKSVPEDRPPTPEESFQNDKTDDYDYDGTPNVAADKSAATASSPKATILPYFENKIVRKNVKPGGTITLECPAKNMANNVILWWKENNTITNNLNILDKEYELSEHNFSLIIKKANESLAGNYYCEILPQKVRMQTILTVSNETTPMPTMPSETTQLKEASTTPSAAANIFNRSALLILVAVSFLTPKFLSHRRTSLLSY